MTEAELAVGTPAQAPDEPDPNSLRAIAQRKWEAWKAGDVGVMPVVVALIIITAVFYKVNSNFLTAGNFTNLMVQMAGVTTIAIGVVFVLLLGEIDLSIGYVSGIAGVVVAKLQFPDSSWEVRGVAAIAIAVLVTALIGAVPGQLRRDHRRAVFRRHARRPPVLAGRDPLLDRRPGRDRDRRLADQQRRELLLL